MAITTAASHATANTPPSTRAHRITAPPSWRTLISLLKARTRQLILRLSPLSLGLKLWRLCPQNSERQVIEMNWARLSSHYDVWYVETVIREDLMNNGSYPTGVLSVSSFCVLDEKELTGLHSCVLGYKSWFSCYWWCRLVDDIRIDIVLFLFDNDKCECVHGILRS